jgi:hypothetical protein
MLFSLRALLYKFNLTYSLLNDKDTWNIRLSWEFKPLSFLYLVYNHGAYTGSLQDRQVEQHLISKLSYLKQF